jgi:hypothetical protein
MGHFGDQIVAILTAIIGVAILAVIVSKNSNTTNVIGAAAQGFSEALSTAISPISGNSGFGISGTTYMGPNTGFAGLGSLNL